MGNEAKTSGNLTCWVITPLSKLHILLFFIECYGSFQVCTKCKFQVWVQVSVTMWPCVGLSIIVISAMAKGIVGVGSTDFYAIFFWFTIIFLLYGEGEWGSQYMDYDRTQSVNNNPER